MATNLVPPDLPPEQVVSDFDLINKEEQPQDNTEEIEYIVKSIMNQIDIQERPSRQVLIKLWKYLDLLWSGISNFYWNTAANEWRVITQDDIKGLGDAIDIDSSLLNKTINLIRPYGESLIGVLTTGTPRVKYFPEDADVVDDIRTAKAYSIIEKKIADDNNMKARIIEILVRLWNNGFAAVYNYSHKSPEYGSVTKPIMGDNVYQNTIKVCPECGYEFQNDRALKDQEATPEKGLDVQVSPSEPFETPPTEEQPPSETNCPQCNNPVTPFDASFEETQNEQVGTVELPKSKQILKVYGPLHVKIPVKASCKEECIFLVLEEELHESLAKTLYPDYADQIRGGDQTSDLGWDRWARAQYENMAEMTQYYVTMRKLWLRPTGYWIIGDAEKVKALQAEYPNGLVAVFAGDRFLYCEESILDEHWTLSFNPLYYRLYGDPLGKALIPLQETANDLFQLEIETVRYAIPQTWADPQYVDFEAYSKSKAAPGMMYPLKAGVSAGKNVGEIFYETKAATLPDEVNVLDQKLERLLQFISGILPPVFGGTQAGGSKTLGEVEQNRNQALQRLGIIWYVINMMYTETMNKAVKAYKDELLEDEHLVEAKGDSFINVWIRMSDLAGKVGKVTPEYGEQFPLTWAQKQARLMELLNLNNELVNAFLSHPENIGTIANYIIGIDGIFVPGDDQRNKQLLEIAQMVSIPMPDPEEIQLSGIPPMPQPIPIEPIDDNAIHLTICDAYLVSDRGQELKESNPIAYQSVMAHRELHNQVIMQQQLAQAQAEAEAAQANQPQNPNKSKPVGASNA